MEKEVLKMPPYIMHTNVKSLYCTPETNIMLHVNYTLIKKKKCLHTNLGLDPGMKKGHS